MRRHFDNGYALAELPWFELRDERLVLDPAVGPIIDVHTHLALTFGRRGGIDLRSAEAPTRHYLPLERPLDFEVYQNRNIPTEDLRRLKLDLALLAPTDRGLRRTHTAPNLLAEMNEMGVRRSVLLPIDLPILSWNAERFLEVAASEPALVSLGSVHALRRRARERLEAQKAAGARGVKVHPAVQLLRPDHPRSMPIYRWAGELDLPIMWHCGPVDIETRWSRYCSQVAHYEAAIREHPGTRFVLGHTGALQYEQAIQLARRYENCHVELACQSLPAIQRIIDEVPIEKIMYGSDWPFYHQSIGIAKVLMATEGRPTERRLVLHDNAARFYGLT